MATVHFIVLGGLPLASPARAQCGGTGELTIATILESCPDAIATLGARLGLSAESIERALREAIRDPETLNRGLAELGRTGLLNGLLSELNVQFVNLQQGGSGNVLGLTYDWSRDLKHDTLSVAAGSPRAIGLHFTGSAHGTVALERDLNPRDFLDSKLALGVFGSFGGVVAGEEMFGVLNALEDTLATYPSLDALESSRQFREFFGAIWDRLSTQTYLSLAANGGLEADQTFDTKQWVFGLNAGLDIKAWNPGSTLAQWNVFDWPAAALRYLFGADDGFHPSGAAIPTLVVGIDRVDPTDNEARAALAALEPYGRFRFEVAYRSPLVPLSNGSISVEAGWRYYREMGAPDAIRTADLDSFSYVVVAITVPNGMYAAWSQGRFPFDQLDDQVYEIGFQTRF